MNSFPVPTTFRGTDTFNNSVAEPRVECHCRTITSCCCELSKWLSSAIITSEKKQMTRARAHATRRNEERQSQGPQHNVSSLHMIVCGYESTYTCTYTHTYSFLFLFISPSSFVFDISSSYYRSYRKHRNTLYVSWNQVYRSDNIGLQKNKNKPVNNIAIVQLSSFSPYTYRNVYTICSGTWKRSINVDFNPAIERLSTF